MGGRGNVEGDRLCDPHVLMGEGVEGYTTEICFADILLRGLREMLGPGDETCSSTYFSSVERQPFLDRAAEVGLRAWDLNVSAAMIAFRPRPLPQE